MVLAHACECGEELQRLELELVISPDQLDWGTVSVGLPSTETLQFGNRGNGSLTIASVVIEPADAPFTVGATPLVSNPM